MHLRIRQLSEQAHQYANQQNELYGTDYQDTYTQRLVQLAAEDCARVLDEDSVWNSELGGYAHDLRVRYGIDPVETLEK